MVQQQCQGVTSKGKRCHRRQDEKFCWQHEGGKPKAKITKKPKKRGTLFLNDNGPASSPKSDSGKWPSSMDVSRASSAGSTK